MAIDRKKVEEVFQQLGDELYNPTTLCVFGSAPAISRGQPARQTQDIDVWQPGSVYDAGDLSRACSRIGILYDPNGEIDPDAIYIQIVRPGLVALPREFETETIGRYGQLTVVMPAPAVLAAVKLVRANENDVADIVWWIRHSKIRMHQIEQIIAQLPDHNDREIARENLVIVKLVSGG
ncbi:MAG: DUF6036 family nucleotidyltransferase [Methylococcales bacterium]